MATNKRKEAAALFELLDKSSLKVPKGGSLKIPGWWSNKSGDKAAENGAKDSTKTNGNGHAGAQARQETPPALPDEPAASEASVPAPLFEPPPANAVPVSSPSIRPPSVRPPVTPAVKAPATGAPIHDAEAAEEVASAAPTHERSAPKVFAPQTHAQHRKPWAPPRPGAFARVPPWVMLCGVAGVLLILMILFIMFGNSGKSGGTPNITSGATPQVGPPVGGAPVQPPIIPTMNNRAGRGATSTPPSPNRGQQGVAPTGGGEVFQPRTVERKPELYYIVIASTRDSEIAKRNAEHIAKNGVNVSIELINGRNGLWYTLISVEGFATEALAKPLQKKIVEIGHQLPEYRRTGQAWDGAEIKRNIRPASN